MHLKYRGIIKDVFVKLNGVLHCLQGVQILQFTLIILKNTITFRLFVHYKFVNTVN